MVHRPDAGILRGQAIDDFSGSIPGAVVHHDNFESIEKSGKHVERARDNWLDIFGLIVSWKNQGEGAHLAPYLRQDAYVGLRIDRTRHVDEDPLISLPAPGDCPTMSGLTL
jgi:hypothetical protein